MTGMGKLGRAVALVAAASTFGACVEIGGVDLVIDLDKKTLVATLHNLRDAWWNDFLLNSEPSLLADLPRVVRTAEVYEPREDRLDLRLEGTFAVPADAGLAAVSDTGPYRLCPTVGFVVTRANAAARDDDGCVLFPRTTRVVRVELARTAPFTEKSLLGDFRDWDARGRPKP